MFALRVTYLTGRVYSALFEDGDDKREPEWPPHPSRLFSALVLAWADGGAEDELRPALEWMEEQTPPAIYAGPCTNRKLVNTYVPVNDAIGLPEQRSRKARTFPSASLLHHDVYFVWAEAPNAEIQEKLDRILVRTSSLGHSSSLVSIEIADRVWSEGLRRFQPDIPNGTRMRIPYRGRLAELERRYERFQKDPNKIHRPSMGKTILYGEAERPAAVPPRGMFDTMIVLRREAGPRASLRSTLSLTAALRGGVMALAPQPVPEFLSGHATGSTPDNPIPSDRPHVAFAPLPFIFGPHATGDIMGLAILMPATLDREQHLLCWYILEQIETLRMDWGTWEIALADAEERRSTLKPETWTQSHEIWSTVTPFVFDRFPQDPYGAEAEAIVRLAFARAGLPEPVEVDLHYNPWHMAVPKASAFIPAPARRGKPQRYHCHVRAQFSAAITGPVIAGAGRYYGYGLFAPLFGRRPRA